MFKALSQPKTFVNTVLAFLAMSQPLFAAEENAQSFTYQGRVMNAAGTAPLTDGTYQTYFRVYDPGGTCLLYEEVQNVTTANGFFSVQVGSGAAEPMTPVGKRTTKNITPAVSMKEIFANQKRLLRAADADCAANYSPGSGDLRLMEAEFAGAGLPALAKQKNC
jgi:hypothetical protein